MTKIKFMFIDRDYEILAIHTVDFPTFTVPVERIRKYIDDVKSHHPNVYSYHIKLVR